MLTAVKSKIKNVCSRAPRPALRPFFATVMGTVAVTGSLASPAPAANNSEPSYCLAIRGNGELEPAHWGALASVVEKLGLPAAQAGGSSATISMFLMENIASNELVKAALDAETKKRRASLLIKSLHGVSLYLGKKPQSQAGLNYLRAAEEGVVKALIRFSRTIFSVHMYRNQKALLELAQKLNELGVGDSPRYAIVVDTLLKPYRLATMTKDELRRLKFYTDDLTNGLSAFGAFDAYRDTDLFMRAGIMDFRKVGLGFGRIATFLAGSASNAKTSAAFSRFVNLCENKHAGKTWEKLAAESPECEEALEQSLDAYFDQNIDFNKVNVAFQDVGRVIPSLPTTAVLVGKAYTDANRLFNRYHEQLDRTAGVEFDRLDRSSSFERNTAEPSGAKLGYWGSPELLAKVERRLNSPFEDGLGRRFDFSKDVKSSLFLGLGQATWSEVMSLSPAEPGLASLQPMTIKGQPALSVGGWSDLHPILVLKAAGCDQVIYVTRKGGESLFAQGVAKRIFGLERDWEYLRKGDAELNARNQLANAVGDVSDQSSRWSKLYNVANPASSYMASVASTDAVVCTDWDQFDIKKKNAVSSMVREAYEAPFVLNLASTDLQKRLFNGGGRFVTDPYSMNGPRPVWAGCRPPQAVR